MIRWKATVSYDGSRYCGWQSQKRGDSVQEQIECALTRVHRQPCEIVASGRTDGKVHALGQVFHFDSEINMDGDAYFRALNALLPSDIRILKVEEVSCDFHARFHAVKKRYDYYLTNDVNNPFLQNYMGMERTVLDIECMKKCAALFEGTHDFTTFTSAKIDPRKSRVKTIYHCSVEKKDDVYHFILEGNGFLRYMVRMIVATIVECGKKQLTIDQVAAMLSAKNKHLCRYKADACGLYLVRVDY